MAVCKEYRISHDEFLSWSDDAQDKAVEYERWLRGNCPECGTREEDWVGDDGFPHQPPRWEADTYRCHGCDALGKMRKTIPEGEHGVRPVIVPFDPSRRITGHRVDPRGS